MQITNQLLISKLITMPEITGGKYKRSSVLILLMIILITSSLQRVRIILV